MSVQLITQTEYETLTQTVFTGDATYFGLLCEAISSAVERWCGKIFTPTTYTDEMTWGTLNRLGVITIRLENVPVISAGAASVVLTPAADFDLDPTIWWVVESFGSLQAMYFRPLLRPRQAFRCKVTYMAGYDPFPIAVKLGVALLIQEWQTADSDSTGKSAGQLVSFKIGQYQEVYAAVDSESTLGLGTGLSQRAMKMLGGFKL